MALNRSVGHALLAASLFGASAPLAKLLLGHAPPLMLAGLLYLGSGLGLALMRGLRDGGWRPGGLAAGEWRWLLGAVCFGGVFGPVLLLVGLVQTSAASASLLLNLEAVLTAVIAWLVFRENAGIRVVLGMLVIVLGGVLLAWSPGAGDASAGGWGAAAIALACLCWAIDNNLTRQVSASDALFIAGCKGLVAGTVNTALALALGQALPAAPLVVASLALGLAGYGVSLVLFVLALRGLGTARTGAYFSVAPFIGAALAVGLLGEPVSWPFWAAGGLMALGVWLHLSEHHEHAHRHEPMTHTHTHRHDAHHQHRHTFDWDGREPHTHPHDHEPLAHSHPHVPDLHHRHGHSKVPRGADGR